MRKQGCPRFDRFNFITNYRLRSIDSIDECKHNWHFYMCVCIRIPFDRFHYVFDLMVFGFFGLVGQPSKCSLDSNSVNYYQQRRSKHGFSDSAMWKFLRPGVYQCFPVTCMPCHKRNITYLSDVELVSLCLCLGTTVAVFQLFLERQIAVFTKLHNKPISPNYLHLHSND